MSSYQVAIDLDLPEGVEKPHACGDEEFAKAMVSEVEKFDEWFRGKGNQPLIGAERSILRTYLAWKFLYEEG